eukprot:2307797-Pleurochrysis_carterae.AAC.1
MRSRLNRFDLSSRLNRFDLTGWISAALFSASFHVGFTRVVRGLAQGVILEVLRCAIDEQARTRRAGCAGSAEEIVGSSATVKAFAF